MTTATILIPDISGFTQFLTQTEIKHSSHIINELLEGIIHNNELGFHLSEVEGDAVLFYKKGDPISRDALIGQCVQMYRHFHCQLKVIERDSICRCGACSTASSLTLKFIVHFGDIREIKISNFLKATGADMIVAHRLLKNSIENHEYLLLSKPYLSKASSAGKDELKWETGSEEYASIGQVHYEYACLEALRNNLSVPEPPPLEIPPDPLPQAPSVSIDLDVPMTFAYQNLIDTDKRNVWVKGMTKMERQQAPERAGFTHYCLTEGLGLDHTAVSASFGETEMTYIEKVVMRRWGLTVWDHYKVENLPGGRSRLSLRFAFRKPNFITRLVEKAVLRNVQKDFSTFKEMCEREFKGHG
jgi:hypothetical protein